MIIETKRTIGDFVYIMHENKPTRAEIVGIYTMTTSMSYPNSAITYKLYGISGERQQGEVYSTKEELLQSL